MEGLKILKNMTIRERKLSNISKVLQSDLSKFAALFVQTHLYSWSDDSLQMKRVGRASTNAWCIIRK